VNGEEPPPPTSVPAPPAIILAAVGAGFVGVGRVVRRVRTGRKTV
jgi:hypothetical protein